MLIGGVKCSDWMAKFSERADTFALKMHDPIETANIYPC